MRHLPDIVRVAAIVHPEHPEEPGVFADRLRLFPAGCLVLEQGGGIVGYAIGYPWVRSRVPVLDRRLGRLPDGTDSLLIHDLALMPAARGGGHGQGAMLRLREAAVGSGLGWLSLVSLAEAVGFWMRMGFRDSAVDPASAAALAGYGAGAVAMERPA